MKTKTLKAKFTQFDTSSQWVNGECGKYGFEAKLFDTPSTFGIDNGRVSKLSITDESKNGGWSETVVVNYDRGWDIEPNEEVKPYFNAIMELLENSPKRF